MLSIDEVKEYISRGQCPFCKSPKVYKCLSNHTCPKHGISASKLREMFGLNITTSTCTSELSQIRSENRKKLPLEIRIKNLKEFWGCNRGEKGEYPRQELLENRRKYARTEKHISIFKDRMSKVSHEIRSAISSNRSPEVRKIISLKSSQRAKELKDMMGEIAYKERMRKMSSQQPYKDKVKGCKAMREALKEKWGDPEFKKNWMKQQRLSRKKWMKLPYEKVSQVIEQYNKGKSQKELAKEYKVSKSRISQIIIKSRDSS
mgnify:CR=1 FL=1